jgi:hypothetical protein
VLKFLKNSDIRTLNGVKTERWGEGRGAWGWEGGRRGEGGQGEDKGARGGQEFKRVEEQGRGGR